MSFGRTMLYGLFVVAALHVGFASTGVESPAPHRGPVRLDDADPNATMSLIEHDIGNLRMTISNYGVLGNPNSTPRFYNWEWPIHSGNSLLFDAGIWVGAQINGVHRVSTTTDGDNGTEEFWPEHIGTRPPQNPSADWWVQSCCLDLYHGRYYERTDTAHAYQEYTAVYQDSIQLAHVRHPDIDGHVPLNIEIRQRSRAWPGTFAQDAILVDYVVGNRGTEPLQHLYLAVFADPDILAAGDPEPYLLDGNYYDATRRMGVQGRFNFWHGQPTPGLWAMKVIATPAPLDQLRMTFRNYGRLAGGDPPTDADKYATISSGGINDTTTSSDDYRMLIGFGADATDGFTLAPDSTLRFTIAYLSGANIAELDSNADHAQELYDEAYNYHPPAPPENLHVVSTSPGTVQLAWSPPLTGPFVGYNLFGRDSAGLGPQVQFNTSLIADTAYTVTGLNNGDDWLFLLQSVDSLSRGSIFADVLCRVAAPFPITGLTGSSQNGTVLLTWNPSPEPNVVGYRVTRTIWFDIYTYQLDTFRTTAASFTDTTPRRGYQNIYRVQAQNSLGLYSLNSASDTVLVWNPEHRILLMDETNVCGVNAGCFNPDSANALYHRLMNATGLDYDYCHEPGCGTVDSLARYDLVIWCDENRQLPSNPTREALLRRYVASGGRLLRIARHFFDAHVYPYPGVVSWPGTWASLAPLGFDSVFVTRYLTSHPGMQFSGASAALPGFPNVSLDTARVHTIHFSTNRYDYLPEVDVLWPRGDTRALYRSVVLPTDSSGYANQPCGVIGRGEIVLTFPLYFLHESDAQALVVACIDTLQAMNLGAEPKPSAPMPNETALHAGYPNPFNPTVTLRYDVAKEMPVKLAVYNVLGQEVALLVDAHVSAGAHQILWNAAEYSSGIYFAVLEAGKVRHTQKLILLK